MKKISVMAMLLLLCTTISFAQRTYSEENLNQLSTEKIDLLLEKAKVNKTIGMTMSIVGPVTLAALFISADNMDLDTAGAIALFGICTTLIGIPLLIVNSSRVKKIRNAFKDNASVEIAPIKFQNYTAKANQVGVTIRFKF